MADDADASRRRAANRLTTIKLALQMLERNTDLSTVQRHVVDLASDATDGLVRELTEQRPTGMRDTAEPRIADAAPMSGHAAPAALRGSTGALAPILRAAGRRRRPPRPTKAAAILIAAAMLVLALIGPALLLGLVGVLLFVAAAAWVIRR